MRDVANTITSLTAKCCGAEYSKQNLPVLGK